MVFNQHAYQTFIDKGIVLCSGSSQANQMNQRELNKIKAKVIIYKSQCLRDFKETDKSI